MIKDNVFNGLNFDIWKIKKKKKKRWLSTGDNDLGVES